MSNTQQQDATGSPDFPAPAVEVGRVEPVPRRVRAMLAGRTVLDTTRARYVWEQPAYPRWAIPTEDFTAGVLVDEDVTEDGALGKVSRYGLRVGESTRPGAVHVLTGDAPSGLGGTATVRWSAVDAWLEEDEEVFVHPRNPYSRVDAIRSCRSVRVELEGVVLAESGSPVMVFETGLPTRYYLDRTAIDWTRLVATDTVSQCPYKGITSGYWSVKVGETLHEDLAWAYDFPTRQLLPIAGLVAFYNEKVDIVLDGQRLARPVSPFS